MVEAALDFFFDMIKWSFNFLLNVEILNVPVLYILFAILLLAFIITALVNIPNAGNAIISAGNSKRRRENEEMRAAKLKRLRK